MWTAFLERVHPNKKRHHDCPCSRKDSQIRLTPSSMVEPFLEKKSWPEKVSSGSFTGKVGAQAGPENTLVSGEKMAGKKSSGFAW